MCKNCLVVSCVLLLGLTAYAGPVGQFDDHTDVGLFAPAIQIGDVSVEYIFQGTDLVDRYTVTGGGGDVWDNWDQFHFAYKTLSGDVRLSAELDWLGYVPNDWAKMFTMVRASLDRDSVHFISGARKDNKVVMQGRESTGGGSFNIEKGFDAVRFGIERVQLTPVLSYVQGLADYGSGWEVSGSRFTVGLPENALVGIGVGSHANWRWELAQMQATDVLYERDIDPIGGVPVPTVPCDGAVEQCPTDQKGFHIRSIKALLTDPWGWGPMDELLDTGCNACVPGVEEGSRIDPVVNLRDSSDGVFGDNRSFPGIDPYEYPAGDPAAGDDDNNFATEVLACIYLTAGYHIIGANSDDGTYIVIGGVEVGRTEEWKGASNRDFVFNVECDGYYPLMARWLEGGGGANLELHEILGDGTRILLGATDDQGNFLGSPVYVPEPATIALLGLGGLALLRIRKKR